MLKNEQEQKRHQAQDSQLRTIESRIAACEKAIADDTLPVVTLAELEQTLATLKQNRAELWARFPSGDVSALFGDPSSLTYDRPTE